MRTSSRPDPSGSHPDGLPNICPPSKTDSGVWHPQGMDKPVAVNLDLRPLWHALSTDERETICGRDVTPAIAQAATDGGVTFPVAEPRPEKNERSVGERRTINCGWCRHGEKPPTPPARLVGWCARCSTWQRIDEIETASPCLNETCSAPASEIRNMTELMRRSNKVEWLTLADAQKVFPAPVDIEGRTAGYEWRERFESIKVLDVGEGFSIHTAIGEGSFWIVRDSGTLADLLDEDEAKSMSFVILERYEERAAWETMVQLEVAGALGCQ